MHCPYCVGRRPVIGVNDLETLNPELARQWHPVKNGELSPKDVQPNCKKLIWWRCDNGHEWIMCPKSRFNGQGCPVCAQEQALSVSDRLSDCFPQLVQQWNYRRNGVLKPQDVSINSAKRVWWQCDQGHEWPATVQSRTKTDIHCPICSGKRLLRGVNDLATVNPELAEQWSEKNAPITSGDVAVNSSERVWWKCPKGHLWRASVASRTSGKAICPYCKRKTSVTAELKDE